MTSAEEMGIEVGKHYILQFPGYLAGMVGPVQCHGHRVKVVEREREPGSSDGYVYHVQCSCGNGGTNGRWWGILPEALKETFVEIPKHLRVPPGI
jgi:hypothetical protein